MRMIRNLLISASVAGMLLPLAELAHTTPQMLDRVVAVVDRNVVTQSELDDRIASILLQFKGQNVRLPSKDILQEQVLDQLIAETLQLETARRYRIEINDQQVLDAIARLAKSKSWTQADLENNLAQDGKTLNELRENIRRELTIREVSRGMVMSRIRISEQDVNNFLSSADAQFWVSPSYKIGHILIAISQSASVKVSEDAEKKAGKIYKSLQKGANFAETAIAESKGPAALNGGDLGWRKSSDLPTLFAKVLPDMEAKDISKPFRSPAGFHILKVYDIRDSNKQKVIETKARHILVKETEILSSDQAKAKLEKIRQTIINGQDFAEAAKEHSDDIASKLSGGSLGWSRPGMFVPIFEKTIKNSVINDISQPFKSTFGWHIVQVLERRTEDMTEETVRNKARRILMSRRYEDEVQLWLQEMRDEAFIQIKI